MEAKDKRAEFKVVLEGVELTEEQERSIRRGIQTVVASHLAELDFEGDRAAGILGLLGGHGRTQGIVWRPEGGREGEKLLGSLEF